MYIIVKQNKSYRKTKIWVLKVNKKITFAHQKTGGHIHSEYDLFYSAFFNRVKEGKRRGWMPQSLLKYILKWRGKYVGKTN